MAKFYIKDFGDVVVNTLKTAASGLGITGLASDDIDWARGMYNEPVYIQDPNDLPKIKVRFNGLGSQFGQTIGNRTLQTEYIFSIFYYRKQVVGEDHQELLIQDLEKIAHVFNEDALAWRPTDFAAVGGEDEQQLQHVFVADVNMFPEMHYSIDLPSLRISCGELRLVINSWSY